MHISLMSQLGTLALFLLLTACAGLWYGARAVRRQKGAPRWASNLDQHRALVALLLGLAIVSLVGFGVVALVAPLLSEG